MVQSIVLTWQTDVSQADLYGQFDGLNIDFSMLAWARISFRLESLWRAREQEFSSSSIIISRAITSLPY